MKKVFFIYWAVFLIVELVKYYFEYYKIQADHDVSVNFLRLDFFVRLFFIPLAYFAVDWTMQERKDYRYMFFCLASYLASVAFYLLTIDDMVEGSKSFYKSSTAQFIYGMGLTICAIIENPFMSLSEKLNMAHASKQNEGN